MRKFMSLAAVLVVGLLCVPVAAPAAGVEGATVTLTCTDADPAKCPAVPITSPVLTDAEGAFLFDGLTEASWRLEAVVTDPVDSTIVLKSALLNFPVPLEKAPAKLAGRVTTLDGADLSLQVNAMIVAPGSAGIVLDPGYPRVQPAWNRNWVRANGRLHVRLAGTGLEGLEKVVLTSAKGSIETTFILLDPKSGEYHAVFAKRAAFAALVPVDAVRGDVIPITVGLTNALGTDSFDASFRVVGPMKRRP